MTTFTDAELKLIRTLRTQPPLTVLQIKKPCPTHSVCTPLPLFRIYKIDDASFEAQWNGYHETGTKQVFRFDEDNSTQRHEDTNDI
jgi:hypothetical protein